MRYLEINSEPVYVSASAACSRRLEGSPWLCTALIPGREEAAALPARGCSPGAQGKGF